MHVLFVSLVPWVLLGSPGFLLQPEPVEIVGVNDCLGMGAAWDGRREDRRWERRIVWRSMVWLRAPGADGWRRAFGAGSPLSFEKKLHWKL